LNPRTHDEAFTALVERHGHELRIHCYRMTGSLSEAEELVQETFLRAWTKRGEFGGRPAPRAWLYRIATNLCLDVLRKRSSRLLPDRVGPPSDPSTPAAPRDDIAWLEPFPDRLLETVTTHEPGPEEAVVAKETIELAFVAAIQHLPPRQRAALILADVIGWSSKRIATLLDSNDAAINSALLRARKTLSQQLPRQRSDWSPTRTSSAQERALLRDYMHAIESADLDAMAAVLAADVRTMMPPLSVWFEGREAVLRALAASWDPGGPAYVGRFRLLPTAANRQPALASYVQPTGATGFVGFAITVLRIEGGAIAEATAFHNPALFASFDLPPELSATRR
jgi:RNA polymerase sigma-70 factor, ECF subfamily